MTKRRVIEYSYLFVSLLSVLMILLLSEQSVFAKKGSGMIYEDPFDFGSGGASLTRATQAGMLIANPAQIPYGDGFHRWVGIEPTVIVGKDSIDFAQESAAGGSEDQTALINTLTQTPIHVGISQATAYINKGFGLGVFSRFESDIFARKYGETGWPEISFQAESYHGAAVSLASLVLSKALSFGLTTKYLYAAEPELAIEVTDTAAIQNLGSSTGMASLVTHNTGIGYDAGIILFSQGMNVDYKAALKADDIGGTALSGEGTLTEIPQTISLGLSTTIHNSTDAIHLALDYRDIQGAHQEKLFKRVRAGAKILIRRYVGIGAGILDGNPSYAAELDLLLVRITAAFYTRELGESPGVMRRPIYAAGVAVGF